MLVTFNTRRYYHLNLQVYIVNFGTKVINYGCTMPYYNSCRLAKFEIQ